MELRLTWLYCSLINEYLVSILQPIHKDIHQSSQNLVRIHGKSHYSLALSLFSCLYAHSTKLQK